MRRTPGETTVLITGGTGSFGRTMARHLLERGYAQIRILSRDEAKQDDMRNEFADARLRFYIGDVRDADSVGHAMRGAHLVFHAAALKQVPSCEFFPLEAVRTNVLGSSNVLEQGVRLAVDAVICLSTDKAVYPINAMGMSKALMEKTAQAATRAVPEGGTRIACVRYGNVMYSRGSVIPLFVRQIREGRPLTITDPEMTRFLLPLPQAVDLVEFAFEHAKQGDLLIRKAPASTVADLASALKNIFEAPNPIEVIGIRHGEKIYETLATKEELRRADDLGGYYRIHMDSRDLNYAQYFSEGDPEEAAVDDYHSHNTQRLTVEEVEQLLLSLPEVQAAVTAIRGGDTRDLG